MSDNLWGSIDTFEHDDEIFKLLQKQAEILSTISRDEVEGEVTMNIDDDDNMNYEFRISSSLLNYSKLLFIVFHPLTSTYPVRLFSFAIDENIECDDYEALVIALRELLSGEKIGGLLKNLFKYSMNQ